MNEPAEIAHAVSMCRASDHEETLEGVKAKPIALILWKST